MKNFALALLCAITAATAFSCTDELFYKATEDTPLPVTGLKDVARILSEIPLEKQHLQEVFDAVNSSSSNGFDEEYLMADLFASPGKGVGQKVTRASETVYTSPLRDVILDYLSTTPTAVTSGHDASSGSAFAPGSKAASGHGAAPGSAGGPAATKAPVFDAQSFIDAVTDADMQIYWPYSEDWDGETFPIITFDPGYGMQSNYGYRIRIDDNGGKIVDSVYVDENTARSTPVWVINTNDDALHIPLSAAGTMSSSVRSLTSALGTRKLYLRTFEAKRNYDTWFGGASEFFIKCGSVEGFSASTEAELALYYPSVTDFMIVVKRKDINKPLYYDAILMTDFTNQVEKIAFLLYEDDGGTQTSWKCSAVVRVKSKSYGFELEIPYRDKDDIVWRGQLSSSFLQSEDVVSGRFGDVELTFALE